MYNLFFVYKVSVFISIEQIIPQKKSLFFEKYRRVFAQFSFYCYICGGLKVNFD